VRGAVRDELRGERRFRSLKRAAAMASREFLAEDTDEFNVCFQSDEKNRGDLDALVEGLLSAMTLGMASELPTPDEELIDRESHDLVVSILNRAREAMTKAEQTLLSMRFVEQRKYWEIAEALKADKSTMRRHVEALLEKLYQALVAEGITEAPRRRR
jgi:DNA-directed RNA polymerase specialized sigma24 family protein